MSVSKLTWAGIVCVTVAIATFGAWAIWLQARISKPVYMPVSMAPGQIHTKEFWINRSGPYFISIEAKKRIPFDMLNCLLGMPRLSGASACDRQSVVQANWSVTSGGVVIAKGSIDADKGAGWANDTIERGIGRFNGESGRSYILDVDFTTDGSALSATDPHLIVEVSPDVYEGDAWISFCVLGACSVFALVGVVFLAACAIRALRNKRRDRSLVM